MLHAAPSCHLHVTPVLQTGSDRHGQKADFLGLEPNFPRLSGFAAFIPVTVRNL